MQTFLPHASYNASSSVLDYRRLGKQRIECKQILNTLMGVSEGWANHPAVKMWEGYEYQLCVYGHEICCEWRRRGYKDQQLWFFAGWMGKLSTANIDVPHWIGNEEFHASHRSNLLRKDPKFYGQYGWKEPDDLAYLWPV